MSDRISLELTDVAETLLIPLYVRAVETQRPDALLQDARAVELVGKIAYDFTRIRLQKHDEVGMILRLRQFDRFAREFLKRNPEGVVIHIGCGFDTRFERVDNGRVEWFDLDLPEVIALRERWIAPTSPRCHLLSGSVFDEAWLAAVQNLRSRPFLFIAEGVLCYFSESQVKALALRLRQEFPGCELVCDAIKPFAIWLDNFQLIFSGLRARLRWGLKHPHDVERWAPGITLLEEWYYFEQPDPRMNPYRWMRHISLLGKSTGIFHYRLGEAP